MPKISVIVPVYKVEPYLARCVDSILAQTFTDFELILVDDGSPDNCPVICDAYKEKDSRVVVLHQENGGLSSARNAALDYLKAGGTSEWVTFIDSDDWVHITYLEDLYNAALETGLGLAIAEYTETSDYTEAWNNAALFSPAAPEVWKAEEYRNRFPINGVVAWGKLYRVSDFADIRYPVGKIHEDEFTTYKLLYKHEQVAVVRKPLYYYFVNPAGITKSQWTPRRLDFLDALYEKSLFYKEHGEKERAEKELGSLYFYMNYFLHCFSYPDKTMKKQSRKRLKALFVRTYREFRRDISGHFRMQIILGCYRLYCPVLDWLLTLHSAWKNRKSAGKNRK